jgi:multiple sugar transport system ATP-binding protein
MASVNFAGVGKIYPDGTRAIDDLNLEIEDGGFTAVVGPSGCGKTTALRMVAGLEEVSEGQVRIGEVLINDVEPSKRDIAMVFQNYALYPHMTVFDNIAFPLRSRGVAKAAARDEVIRVAKMLRIEESLKKRPRTLSGGQRQRVAMGRALVRRPQVFLMDEPLSNLDAKLRVQMRAEIAELQRKLEVTTIYVTHDQVEAMTMATNVAIMRKGVLQQVAPPQVVYERPANLFVATFIGSPAMNLFEAMVETNGDGLACIIGDQKISLPARGSGAPGRELGSYVGRTVAVGIRPEHLGDPAQANGHAPPLLGGSVRLVETLGATRLVHLELRAQPVVTEDVLEVARDADLGVAADLAHAADEQNVPVVAQFGARSSVRAGDTADVTVALEELHYFDLTTGAAVG